MTFDQRILELQHKKREKHLFDLNLKATEGQNVI